MGANILLSKIVANPGETTWSQAYSTLNLYIVLSIKSETAEASIVNAGKELLEKIQREYFSLDQKSLKNIKEALGNATAEHENQRISVVLATITNTILYIVIAGFGTVILKRGEKIGAIAEGEDGNVLSFSGELAPDDIVVLETEDFSKKIPISKLSANIDSLAVSEISESLAPLIHEESQGTEAAIAIQYKKAEEVSQGAEEENAQEHKEKVSDTKYFSAPKFNLSFPKLNISNLSSLGRKNLIIVAIILLVVVLLGSVGFEKIRQENAKRKMILSEIIDPAQEKFDEAVALASLNKGLALGEFEDIKRALEDQSAKLKEGSSERKKLDEFIGKVEGKIGELSQGAALANQKLIFDKEADFVGFRDGTLFVIKAQSGEITLISTGGKVQKSAKSENKNIESLASDSNAIYTYGNSGITKTDQKSGKTTIATEDAQALISLDTFGSNLYGLNAKTKTVDKYANGSSTRSDYFKTDVTLNNPVSMAIDSSVWIIDSGKVRKFTKGAEETFTLSGLTKDISQNAKILTGPDYENVYILDKDTNRIISISKSGEVQNQYVSKNLSDATSFAVDESGGKIYVVIANKLYSFDL